MRLESISAINYKNIAEAELTLSAGVNCLVGKNGMGKTNLLDAIAYLSTCRSASPLADRENIRHGEDFFMLRGTYALEGGRTTVQCGLKRGGKKTFRRDGKEYQRLSEHIGLLPVVMSTPSDGALLTGGSEERRRFMDQTIAQHDKTYLAALMRYNEALAQRNALLKMEPPVRDVELYKPWEEQLETYGRQIYEGRRRLVAEIEPTFQEFYAQVSLGRERVELHYTSHMERGTLTDLLDEVRARDAAVQYTTRGVHKDDVEMTLDGLPMRHIGSQGQNKTLVVTLRLAQYDYLRRRGHTVPLLLLDDIFDRLDADRVEQIVRLVASERFGQIFITDTNREHLDRIIGALPSSYRLWAVDHGSYDLLSEGPSEGSATAAATD